MTSQFLDACITFIPNTEIIDPDEHFGPSHTQLLDASRRGDHKSFLHFAHHATKYDLEWCLDVCCELNILKWLVERKGVKQNFHHCYVNAVINNRKEIIEYIESVVARSKCIRYLVLECCDIIKTSQESIKNIPIIIARLTHHKASHQEMVAWYSNFFKDVQASISQINQH